MHERRLAVLIFFQIVFWSERAAVASPAVSPETGFTRSFEGSFDGTEAEGPSVSGSHLQLIVQDQRHVAMDNGIIRVTLSVPNGFVTAIHYRGSENIVDASKNENDRGYWDMNWSFPGSQSVHSLIASTRFEVIRQDSYQIELSFLSTWSTSNHSGPPVNIDKRFIMLPGRSGFYCYGIYERPEGWPALRIDETRIVFKLNQYDFRYMALSDSRQRIMPLYMDRLTGQPLAYPEAILLLNATDPAIRGEVDDKYQYSCDNMDNRVHGWISVSPSIGFWIITPSNEFRNGGPLKQDLTSHVGPFTLAMFVSQHYVGRDAGMVFTTGEPWKKVFGPVFVHLNSKPFDNNPITLWAEAKAQMLKETESWPYNFPLSKDFAHGSERGQITGRLHVCDRNINRTCSRAAGAHVGLAAPGAAGSWQTENKGYQFWTVTDQNGDFLIKGVRAGRYNLYGWVLGVVGDFRHDANVTIRPGSAINLGDVVYNAPRHGQTLWQIGVADRTAAEFFIPDPDPRLVNRLYIKHDRFRQYGLWQRYTELYPKQDLVYVVGSSDYRRDWFFAHVTRNLGGDRFAPTTWRIVFELQRVFTARDYVLRVAVAAATESDLQIHVNEAAEIDVAVGGHDNAIARHGIHGLYGLHSIAIPGSRFVKGKNFISLTQTRSATRFQGIMYDYIRLEGPPPPH